MLIGYGRFYQCDVTLQACSPLFVVSFYAFICRVEVEKNLSKIV